MNPSSPRTPDRRARVRPVRLVLLLAALLATPAFAQGEPTGTVRAIVDGEERTWRTMRFDGEETGLPTATWSEFMGMFTTLSIQAHPGETFAVEGALSIQIEALEFPSDCPCTYPEATVTLWTTSSMFEAIYLDDAAEVTLERVEPLGDDAYAVEGTFAATPVFHPSITAGPDLEDTISIDGDFGIDVMPKDTTAEDAF